MSENNVPHLALLEVIRSTGYIQINKKILKKLGPNKSVFIGNLIDKFTFFAEHDQLEPDGSFYLVTKHQKETTGMSAHQLRSFRKYFEEIEIISYEKRGLPAKHFYHINLDNLINFISACTTSGQKIEPLDVKKLNHSLGVLISGF